MKKTVTIYGAGYVGLVTGACLAELGHSVLLIDTQAEKIASLQQGICPIHEPGLDTLLQRHIASGRLMFSTDLVQGVQHGLLQFIAVGTPSLPDGSADLRYVFEVATSIAQQLKDYRLIITKSTVPVGTAYQVKQRIEEILKQRNVAVDFDVAANPECIKAFTGTLRCIKR
jgi:UDPglucose 6-dehydrogenase